ncbi:hypothetical protein KSP39_PZI018121 [Platanthera zijinensis]|uniref:DUF7913 domain-containing protein n=1 Tax=Platanthera zijinensis TaxID=2320716 RepID=A0AAP0FYT0_9ASPA
MQAVVILCNYYQRKQSSNSKFLGFRSFWETACICSPSLVDYLKFMCNDAQSLDDLHNQLSITEKLVMDACDICTALNTLSVSCTIDEWPISKVAVFLVDAANEKCLLKNDSIILGSWSLVEKDIEKPIEKLTNAYDVEDVLQKIAYSSVEQDMGMFIFRFLFFLYVTPTGKCRRGNSEVICLLFHLVQICRFFIMQI